MRRTGIGHLFRVATNSAKSDTDMNTLCCCRIAIFPRQGAEGCAGVAFNCGFARRWKGVVVTARGRKPGAPAVEGAAAAHQLVAGSVPGKPGGGPLPGREGSTC